MTPSSFMKEMMSSYDVLHTQSKQYIVDDIISFMKEEGVIV